MDENSGFNFWKKLNEQELLYMISHPEAYSSYMRCFAAQELSNKLASQINGSSNQSNYDNYSDS